MTLDEPDDSEERDAGKQIGAFAVDARNAGDSTQDKHDANALDAQANAIIPFAADSSVPGGSS